MSKRAQNIRKRLLRKADVLCVCMYCGEVATDIEHVYPKSLFGNNTPKVWSCRECNVFASDGLFEDIESKRNYIHEQIRSKYRWVYQTPDWDEDQINELGYSLRTEIIAAMRLKEIITRRLNWKVSVDAMVVAKALEKAKISIDDNGEGDSIITVDVIIDNIRTGELQKWFSISPKDYKLVNGT